MTEQKRFKKKKLDSDEYKGMEQGAKALKGALGVAAAVGMVFFNKNNVKTLGKGVVQVVGKLIKK